MKQNKMTFRFFSILSSEKEEKYLSKQHSLGWEFVKRKSPGIYFFRSCQPADAIYKIDYGQKNCETEDEYYQLIEDFGWKLVCENDDFCYLKKEKVNAKDGEADFFDINSKFDYLKRLFWGKCIPILGVFVFSVILPICTKGYLNKFSWLLVPYALVFIAYIIFFVRYVICYLKLRRQCKR